MFNGEKGTNKVRIVGIGKALPMRVDNKMMLDNTNLGVAEDWIDQKIGIKTRYVSRRTPPFTPSGPQPNFANSDLCASAIRDAAKQAEVNIAEIDMIIVATCTPDHPIPSTSSIVQSKLGIESCAVMDIRSACCGSSQALITALQYCSTGFYKTIAVVGSDVGSIFGVLDKDYPGFGRQDQVNAVMIGDAAAALIVCAFSPTLKDEDVPGIQVLYADMKCIGTGKEPGMWLPAGGSVYPISQEVIDKKLHTFQHDYRAVLEHGPILYMSAMQSCLKGTNVAITDVDVFIPHQANGKIRDFATQFGIPHDRIYTNFQDYGNTANASILLCLSDLVEKDELADGSILMMASAESTKWLYSAFLLSWKSLKKTGKNAKSLRLSANTAFHYRLIAPIVLWLLSWILYFWTLFNSVWKKKPRRKPNGEMKTD